MADGADSGTTPSLYQEMKKLAQTALDQTGIRFVISEMDYIASLQRHKQLRTLGAAAPALELEHFFKVYDGLDQHTVYEPFVYLSDRDLQHLKLISYNRSISCKVFKDALQNDKIGYSMMLRIPSQPQIGNSQTINCEIEFHSEFDEEKEEDRAIVDFVAWYDEAIDLKLVRRARTAYALIAGA